MYFKRRESIYMLYSDTFGAEIKTMAMTKAEMLILMYIMYMLSF